MAEYDVQSLSDAERAALIVAPGDELLFTLGRLRLTQRVPQRLRDSGQETADWYGDAASSLARIGDRDPVKTDIPSVGLVRITGQLRTKTIDELIAEDAASPALSDNGGFPGVPAPLVDLEETIEQALAFADAAKSENTHRAYAADWRIFRTWCAGRGLDSLPADPRTVALFLADEASRRAVSTLRRRLAAIGHAHTQEGHEPPQALDTGTLRDVVAGIARTKGSKPRKALPLMPADIRAIVDALPDDLRGKRDKALILTGYCGNFRRSEVAGILLQDVEIERRGMRITLPFSKGDQLGDGITKAIPRGRVHGYCPVAALEDWLEAAGIAKDAVFRTFGPGRGERPLTAPVTGGTVDRIVKRSAAKAGISGDISAHSLRRGWMTAVAPRERPLAMARHAGHKDIKTSMGYIEDALAFEDHVGDGLL